MPVLYTLGGVLTGSTTLEELEGLLRAANLGAGQNMPDASSASFHGAVPPLPAQLQDLDLANLAFDPVPPGQNAPFEVAAVVDPGLALPSLPQPAADQLVGLGQFEQLPSFELMDELYEPTKNRNMHSRLNILHRTTLFFQKVHGGAPMLHQATYTASIRLPPHMRPPMCLQYIVMASGSATSDIYRHLAGPFYQRARVYAEADELKVPRC